MTSRLHLIRHGQTTANVLGRLDTRPPGAGLTDFGARQAVRFALQRPDAAVAGLYCSVARRARQTAELIGSGWGVEHEVIDGIHEVQVGDLENRNDEESIRAFTGQIERWYRGATRERLSGGENLDDVFARYLPVVEALRRRHADAPGDIFVVSHGAAVRLVAAHLGAVDPDFALAHGLPNMATVELVHRSEAGEPGDAAGWACVQWHGSDPVRPVAAARRDPMG